MGPKSKLCRGWHARSKPNTVRTVSKEMLKSLAWSHIVEEVSR